MGRERPFVLRAPWSARRNYCSHSVAPPRAPQGLTNSSPGRKPVDTGPQSFEGVTPEGEPRDVSSIGGLVDPFGGQTVFMRAF